MAALTVTKGDEKVFWLPECDTCGVPPSPNKGSNPCCSSQSTSIKTCVINDEPVLEKVPTSFGLLSVEVVGDRRKPAIVTYHDIGLNGNSQFQGFFQFSEMAVIADRFCFYHISAPGQEDDAAPMQEGLKDFIGFAVGAGANILMRYALKEPRKVNALILVNATVWQAGWMEWGYQKVNLSYLRSRGMTTFTVDYLMWHHFGRNWDEVSQDMIDSYRHYFASIARPQNLSYFIESWIYRTPLNIARAGPTITCPVFQLVGNGSPHINESVEVNTRLDPSRSDWMKVSDACGLVLEDAPTKVTEAIILFLQGQGYFPTLSHTKWVQARSNSIDLNGPYNKGDAEVVSEVEHRPIRDVAYHSGDEFVRA